jgi:adenosine kinase
MIIFQEALTFSETQNLGTKDIKEITLKLSALPKLGSRSRIAVITQGHDPVLVAKGK